MSRYRSANPVPTSPLDNNLATALPGEEPRCRLEARDALYAPSHRRDSTYHGFCSISCWALVETMNWSMGPIRGIDTTMRCFVCCFGFLGCVGFLGGGRGVVCLLFFVLVGCLFCCCCFCVVVVVMEDVIILVVSGGIVLPNMLTD